MAMYFAVAAGVMLSILLPVLAAAVRAAFPAPAAGAVPAGPPGQAPSLSERLLAILGKLWPIFRPYLLLFVFSLAAALVVLAFLGPDLSDWRAAFLAGYAWDSTIQKITGRPK